MKFMGEVVNGDARLAVASKDQRLPCDAYIRTPSVGVLATHSLFKLFPFGARRVTQHQQLRDLGSPCKHESGRKAD